MHVTDTLVQEFILDDSYSTSQHWGAMCSIFELLSFMVQHEDPDELDLRFSNSTNHIQSTDVKFLKDTVSAVHPQGHKFFGDTLDIVLKAYEKKMDSHPADPDPSQEFVRPLSIYVLTNGENLGSPAPAICSLVYKLEELKYPLKHVGIQFISFGHNKEWLELLRLHDIMSQTWGLPQ